jgi:hypothetical protein
MYKSLDEANSMVGQLEAKIVALEALQRGEVPPPPQPIVQPIPEPIIKIIEVCMMMLYTLVVTCVNIYIHLCC